MDVRSIIGAVKYFWDRWDVRGLMLLSLTLQSLMLVMAPVRKRTSNNWVIGSILCLYLLADWAANFATGVITSNGGNLKKEQPLAFWSTFLMVHLGGPDSITAFALQDNEFWHRHALALVFQCVAATYTFFQTLPHNQLWLPTLLMFVCGFIKYYEKTKALYSASFNNLRDSMRKKPDPGLDYAKMMNVYSAMIEGGIPTRTEMYQVPEIPARVRMGSLNNNEVVLYAYSFFKTFKRLLVDLKCSYYERVQSRDFFSRSTPEDAFAIIALELNFMYDILFTKANSVYQRTGYCLRFFSFALLLTAFGLFYFEDKKFKRSEIAITYALLLVATASDVIAFLQLLLGNWIFAFRRKLMDASSFIESRLPERQQQLKERGKWSESVSGHNLFAYSLNLPRPEAQKLMDWFGVSGFFDGLWYVTSKPFTNMLRDHIFNEVKKRSQLAEGSESFQACIEARGRLALSYPNLLHYVVDMDYDESLLSWHIATELCYSKLDDRDIDGREISKSLSDYMLYLVVMQPGIMYGVTDIGQTRLRDTCAEILVAAEQKREDPSLKRVIIHAFINASLYFLFFIMSPIISLSALIYPLDRLRRKLENYKYTAPAMRRIFSRDPVEMAKSQQRVFDKILRVNAYIEPICIKGDKSKSVLYDGLRLAKELDRLGDNKWLIMSQVWVEMLTYTVVHSRPHALAEQLSKGGELIGFVWLLMAHFGLVHHFEKYGGPVRAKLVVDM